MKRLSVWLVILLLAVTAVLGILLFREKDRDIHDGLVILNYGAYLGPEVLGQFKEETGIEVVYEEYESPESMYTKYKSKAIDYDVICSSDYMVGKLIDEGEVLPVDKSHMENLKYLDPKYEKYCKSFDPDGKFSVPYFLGTVGIMYNTKYVTKEEASSWVLLWDEKYKNQIIMENSVRDALIPALKLNGYSINTMDMQELDRAFELLKVQKPLNYAYLTDESMYEMIMENANIALIYSGEANAAKLENEDLDYEVPKEGSNLWVDSWFIPKTCRHLDEANAFIDFMCRPDIAYENWDEVYYTTPNRGVFDMLDEDEQQDETMFPPEKVLDRCEVFKVLEDDELRILQDMWKQLKVKQAADRRLIKIHCSYGTEGI